MKKRLIGCFIVSLANAQAQSDTTLKTETGVASYYARGFEGRRCSSGEIFRHDSLTAAHKHLRFGTRVRVVNLKNDSSVVVRINDRMPSWSRRSIDLTRRGARQLNFLPQGLTKVRIEILRDSLTAAPSATPALPDSEQKKED